MRLFLLAAALLCLAFPVAAENIYPEGTACAADSECVMAHGPCGEERAVHQLDFKTRQAEWDDIGARVECPRYDNPPNQTPACSLEKQCVLVQKEGHD